MTVKKEVGSDESEMNSGSDTFDDMFGIDGGGAGAKGNVSDFNENVRKGFGGVGGKSNLSESFLADPFASFQQDDEIEEEV